jgi:hypothetical protein
MTGINAIVLNDEKVISAKASCPCCGPRAWLSTTPPHSMSLPAAAKAGVSINDHKASRRTLAFLPSLSVLFLLLITMATPAASEDFQPNRIKIEAVPPTNPESQEVYDLVKERNWLEKIQEFYGIFKLPMDMTIRTVGCDGVSNAWYARPTVTICYEYLVDILKSMPEETTSAGVTPADAVIGQFAYTVSHEIGHGIFDFLDVPVLGRLEDAADQFAVYMMLQLGKDQARRLIGGAAYTYMNYVKNPKVTVPLIAFADVHGAPMQRFYNLLCMAYGADRDEFQDLLDKGYLPLARASSCKVEYGEVDYAFGKLLAPYMDEQLAKKVLDKTWLPNANIRLLQSDVPLHAPATPSK